MKMILAIFLLLCACDANEAYRDFPKDNKFYGNSSERLKLLNNYILETADVQGIMWPLVIDDKNSEDILKVIEASRQLTQLKVNYLKEDLKLKDEYQTHYCDCALYSLCKGEESDKYINTCKANERRREELTEVLPQIVVQLENLKTSIVSANGQWIQVDYVNLDLQNKNIQWNEHSLEIEVSYYKEYTNISATSELLRLSLDISPNASYLDLIGDIELFREGQWRKGVVSFQFPKKIKTKNQSLF